MTRAAERALAAGREARRRGDLNEAARLVGSAFARFQRAGDQTGMARALIDVAAVALDGRDDDTAARALAQALGLVDPDDDPTTAALIVATVARLAVDAGDPATAVRLQAGAAALEGGGAMVDGPLIERAREALGPETVDELWAAGSASAPAEVVALARARAGG